MKQSDRELDNGPGTKGPHSYTRSLTPITRHALRITQLAAIFGLVLILAACGDSIEPANATPTVVRETPVPEATGTRASGFPWGTPNAQRTTTPARATAEATRVAGGGSSGSPTATLLPLSEREALFDDVWQTVKDNYLYADFHGADWNALREEYRPQVLGAASSTEFYELLFEMVDKLNDEHSRFASPEEAREEDAVEAGENSYVGVGILSTYVDDSALVLVVFEGSPAEGAGLERRDRITHVDGVPFDPDANTIRGPEGTEVRLTVKSPGRPPRDVTLTRRAVQGRITASAKRLDDNPEIGYLVVPSLWANDMAEQVEEMLEEMMAGPDLKGIVIDLRGNEGGWRTVLTGILGQFASGRVGSFYTQDRQYPLSIDKGSLNERLKGIPLVLLVDGDTQSYAEVLSGALQASGRAKVVGITTAGNTETVYPYDFDDGSRLWVAQEGFKLPDGTNLEGRGVVPDFIQDVKWTDYSESDDPHILKAVQLIEG